MENCYVCVFISKGRIVKQLLWVFTHQLPNSEESCPVSLAGIQQLLRLVFQVRQAQGDVGAAWDKMYILAAAQHFILCSLSVWHEATCLFCFLSVPVREVASSRRGGRCPKAERTFFLNTLQRWISRTPPQQGSSQCKHNLAPSCVFTTQALEWALFRLLPLRRGILLLKTSSLNNANRGGLHSQLGPHTEVTEPSELAERGNQTRRTRLMPGGREEGWTNTNLLNILSLIG